MPVHVRPLSICQSTHTHRQHGIEQVGDEGGAMVDCRLPILKVTIRMP